jgi:CBS domain-containing protein
MFTQNKNILVKNVMLGVQDFPVAGKETIFKVALESMGEAGIGVICIVDDALKLLGIITDGDVRRKLLVVQKPFSAFFVDDAIKHAVKNPITICSDITLSEAVGVMEENKIYDLPVVDNGKLVGLLHLHPAVQALIDAE